MDEDEVKSKQCTPTRRKSGPSGGKLSSNGSVIRVQTMNHAVWVGVYKTMTVENRLF